MKVIACCISEKKGTVKKEVPEIICKKDFGIVGDAHAGNWHRQISLLAKESVDKIRNKINYDLKPGVFAENILTEGIVLHDLPIGTKLKINSVIMEVTQIGKECHETCEIRKIIGDCIMPKEGIFCKVLTDGTIKKEDEIFLI